MNLKLKAETKWSQNFEGDLYFESSNKKITIPYHFNDGKPTKSLGRGDELNITFKIEDKEFLVKGIFPEVLNSTPERIQCIWALAYELICNNVFFIMTGTEGKATDIGSVSQEMSGEVDQNAIKVLFGE